MVVTLAATNKVDLVSRSFVLSLLRAEVIGKSGETVVLTAYAYELVLWNWSS